MIVAIVQARLGSTRLPGKVLLEVRGKPLITYLFERLQFSTGLKRIIFAVPKSDRRKIQKAIPNAEVWGFSGDENDVWDRYMDARYILVQSGTSPTAVVRLCADSPLIDPAVVDYMLDQYAQDNRLTTNTQRRTWPQGQCVEILPAKGMGRLESVERSPGSRFDHLTAYDREHVMPWYYRNCNYTNVENPLGDFSDVNMCVDTPEDFQRIKETIEKMDRPHTTYGWRELVELMA